MKKLNKQDKMFGKHQQGVNKLYDRLINQSYVKECYKNVEYCLGEMDVYTVQGDLNRGIYYEYKTNHTEKGIKKALKQLQRMTCYYKSKQKDRNFYGVYLTKDTKPVILVKNGEIRWSNLERYLNNPNHYMK